MYTIQWLRYYFGSTGKAYRKSYGKTINGKKYGFDEDGKMLFGYVEDASYNIINDDEDPILTADYYFGTNEDGARHTGWLQYTDALTDHDDDYYWFYFNTSNGKKVTSQMKSINGKKYQFNAEGIMDFKWAAATVSGKYQSATWFNKLENGSLAKNQWIWNKPYEDTYANLESTKEDYADETERWFRTDASGALVKNQAKKVNSKWYVFDEDGVMRTGLVVLENIKDASKNVGAVSGSKIANVTLDGETKLGVFDMDQVTKNDIINAKTNGESLGKKLHYFSEEEEKDGSMKTGTLKIELADDEYTFCFEKNTGASKHGYDSSSKKVYNSGILEKAGDDKYKVVLNPAYDASKNSKYYLVGSTGSVVTAVNKYKDANDKYYVVLKPASGSHDYQIGSTYDEDEAKKAVKAGKLTGDDFSLEIESK